MKVRVVARAFYEDAYLDFFIQYYLAMGFDSIVILKADGCPIPNMDKYPEGKVECIMVANTGNNILNIHKSYYLDQTYDWILNIDADEFLVIDMEKFPDIHAYLEDISVRLDPDQIMFWWICVNKLTCWSPDRQDPVTMLDYINGDYSLDFYKYVKCMARPSRVDRNYVSCHYYNAPQAKKLVAQGNKKRGLKHIPPNSHIPQTPPVKPFVNILDGVPAKICIVLPVEPSKQNTFCDGFILHLNSRSLTNGITKSLVTKLHKTKHFKNLNVFCRHINTIPDSPDKISARHRTTLETHMDGKIKNPKRILAYGKSMVSRVNLAYARTLLDSIVKHMPMITTTPIMSIQAEWDIIDKLAQEKKINPAKLRTLLLGVSRLNAIDGIK